MFTRREFLVGAAAAAATGFAAEDRGATMPSSSGEPFTYCVTDGWIRDLASEPTPRDPWPCIRWDDQLLADQIRFLDVQAELGISYNCVWGLFINHNWPVPLRNVIDEQRAEKLRVFVDAAHKRGIKVLHGTGIYSWGFNEVIAKVPGVAAGHASAMCPFKDEAWDWQRRVLDFLMDPRWGIDGISMQSADQGRCECERCRKLSPAEHHAIILTRSAEHVRASRKDWTIGQACWGLAVHEPASLPHVKRISQAVDYMIEVNEASAAGGGRAAVVRQLACAFGSVGGVFVEPPQHWDRLRWFVPCGLRSARSLIKLHADGGRACEYFYRPFANPGEEISWRVGARVLSSPVRSPEDALKEAVGRVYGVTGRDANALAEWYTRAEDAYFTRAAFHVGSGSLSLEPLVSGEAGPPVYLRDRMKPAARADYAKALEKLRAELAEIKIPREDVGERTRKAIDGTLRDLTALVGKGETERT